MVAERPPHVSSRSWLGYLVVAAVIAAAVAFRHDWWATWAAVLLQLSTGLAVVVGIRRHRPAGASFWWLLAAAQATYTLAQAHWRIGSAGWKPDIPFRSVDDVYYFVAFTLFIAALAVRVHARGSLSRRWTNGIDALIVVLGMSSGTWRFVAQPYLASGQWDPAGIALFWGYEALVLVRMALLATIVLAEGLRTTALRLLVYGIGTQLTGDLIYAVGLPADGSPFDGYQNLAWLLGSVLIGAAALHPSMRAEQPQATEGSAGISRARLVLFILLTMISPVLSGIEALIADPAVVDGSATGPEAIIPMILGVSVSVLLVLRLGVLAGIAQRRAAALDDALSGQAELRDQLAHRATHDPLTGLGNRALLADELDGLMRRPPAERGWLLLLDLDGFKDINDSYGHPAGDELLVVLAGRLRGAVSTGVVTRLGGDEFALLLPGAAAGPAAAVARRVLAAVCRPVPVTGWEGRVTASIGMVELAHAGSAAQALGDADLALYAAKNAGKNRVVRYTSRLRTARQAYTRVSTRLHAALQHGEVALHYQPIVTLDTGAVVAVEALLRWTPPDEEPISPAVFIPIAEETGLIGPLGTWALRTACTAARPWHERHGLSVSVNVSGRQLDDPGFLKIVLGALRDSGLPGPALIIEITESVLLGAAGTVPPTVTATLGELRRHGVRIAIDDFGTGYSSLSYLRQLPVDVLKLDRSLTVSDGGPDGAAARDEAITRAVVELGAGLRLRTVAEGIETAGQADLLRRMGCTLAQGYHFARPMSEADVAAYLTATTAERVPAG